ncbi:Mismatch repair protein msh3 [Dimargaris xerosporica]|nr:Mismatch repair protein msh3 [Dimargaris xerosporica]
MVLTGPNMGGKSCYTKSIALICIMAQMGSHVPATMATLGMVDAIFTRMGAADDLMRGQSTFMLEMLETSELMRSATAQSLVIVDELGRGTATRDGMAIAHAVLDYLITQTRSLTFFITHFPALACFAQQHPCHVQNCYMDYWCESQEDITFLYKVVKGVSQQSYGLQVARMAGLPDSIIQTARQKARSMAAAAKGKVEAAQQ